MTIPPPPFIWRSGLLSVLIAATACDASFLHDVETRREATDRGCPAPNDGANEVAAVLDASGAITVSWTTRATNADSFLIERQSSREPTWGEIGSVAATTFTDDRVVLDEEYGYRVSAVRAAGGSTCATPASAPVTLRTVPRAAQTALARATGVGQITLTWSDPNTFEDGYRVSRTALGGAEVALPELPANTGAFVDTGVTPGTTYVYELVAFNVSGPSDPVTSNTQRAVTPAVLSWTDPPVVGEQCMLTAFGSAAYEAGAAYASAEGVIDGTVVSGGPAGFSGPIAATASGPVETSWIVEDDAGGRATLSRTLTAVQTTSTRSPPRRLLPGEGAVGGEGVQMLRPSCATCDANELASVSTGFHFSCMVRQDGHVACWGSDSVAQLGRGNISPAYHAVRPCDRGAATCAANAPFLLSRVETGDSIACGITADGHALCWGDGDSLSLGSGAAEDSFTAVEVCAVGDATSCTTPLSNVTDISIGADTACAIAGGEVWCWGPDIYDFVEHMPRPVCDGGTLPSCDRFTADQIDVAGTTICATKSGTVYCWGDNDDGVFGTETATGSPTPLPVCISGSGGACVALTGVTRVAVGDDFACARKTDGTLWCWGANTYGQVGNGVSGAAETVPQQVCVTYGASCTQLLTQVASFDVGDSHACAVTTGGEAYCWGANFASEAGSNPSSFLTVATPLCTTGVPPTCTTLTGVATVSTGSTVTCLRLASGEVRCIGTYDLSGNSEFAPEDGVPFPVCASGGGPSCPPLTNASQISVGDNIACAIADGALACWGGNSEGQLAVMTLGGTKNSGEVLIGVGVDGAPLTGVRMVASGDFASCAVRDDGSVWCWGRDEYGVLGTSDSGYGENRGYAQPVCRSGSGSTCASFTDAVSVSVGLTHACAVTAGGIVYCWGGEDCGELGRGNATGACDNAFDVHPRPVAVLENALGSTLQDAVEVALGSVHSCVLRRDGGVVCFGGNDQGQLGIGDTTAYSGYPVSVVDTRSGSPVAIVDRVGVRAGRDNACAIGADGGLYCWGFDTCGQLGNPQRSDCFGSFRADARPACSNETGLCVELTGVIDVALGWEFTCALKRDGTVDCWGWNGWGSLARGYDNLGAAETIGQATACDTTCNAGTCSTPLTGLVGISSLLEHACGVRENGDVVCWGRNDYNQLGSGYDNGSGGSSIQNTCTAKVSCATGPQASCTSNSVGEVRECSILSVVAP